MIIQVFLKQLRSNLKVIVSIFIVSMIFIGGIIIVHLWKDIPIDQLTRDTSALGGIPFYAGLLSQLGIFIWSAAATVCLLSAVILHRQQADNLIIKFFVISALIMLMLGLDDVFLIHESFMPIYVGIPEKVVYVFYILVLMLYLTNFFPLIIKTDMILLLIAFVFLGLSVSIDLILPFLFDSQSYLIEDGAKFIGIVAWLAYFFKTGLVSIDQNAAYQKIVLQSDQMRPQNKTQQAFSFSSSENKLRSTQNNSK